MTLPLMVDDSSESIGSGELDLEAVNILVVDDNSIEAEHARMMLSEAGIKSDICTGGEEALRMMEEQSQNGQPYNIVLTDWNMPIPQAKRVVIMPF